MNLTLNKQMLATSLLVSATAPWAPTVEGSSSSSLRSGGLRSYRGNDDTWEECYPTTLEQVHAISYLLHSYWDDVVSTGCDPNDDHSVEEFIHVNRNYFDEDLVLNFPGGQIQGLDNVLGAFTEPLMTQCVTNQMSWVGRNFVTTSDDTGVWTGDEFKTSQFGGADNEGSTTTLLEQTGVSYNVKLYCGCEIVVTQIDLQAGPYFSCVE